jgi:hypothetical protein
MEALRTIKLRAGLRHVDPDNLSSRALADVPQQGIISSFRKFTG